MCGALVVFELCLTHQLDAWECVLLPRDETLGELIADDSPHLVLETSSDEGSESFSEFGPHLLVHEPNLEPPFLEIDQALLDLAEKMHDQAVFAVPPAGETLDLPRHCSE